MINIIVDSQVFLNVWKREVITRAAKPAAIAAEFVSVLSPEDFLAKVYG